MKKCLFCTVSGHVQGVWFRASTKKKAEELGVTGWVRNLENGDVETQACGTEPQLQAFKAWLHQGPDASRVDSVAVTEVDCEAFSGFRILKN